MNNRIAVDHKALFQVLNALNGPGHLISELVIVAGLAAKGLNNGQSDDPIGKLAADYNAGVRALKARPNPPPCAKGDFVAMFQRLMANMAERFPADGPGWLDQVDQFLYEEVLGALMRMTVTPAQLAERYATSGPLLELDQLLSKFHEAVWDAAGDGETAIAYDLAGNAECKAIQAHVRQMLAAAGDSMPADLVTWMRFMRKNHPDLPSLTLTAAQVDQLLAGDPDKSRVLVGSVFHPDGTVTPGIDVTDWPAADIEALLAKRRAADAAPAQANVDPGG